MRSMSDNIRRARAHITDIAHAVFAFTLNARICVSPNLKAVSELFFFFNLRILSNVWKLRFRQLTSGLNMDRYNGRADISFVFFVCGWAIFVDDRHIIF